MYRRTCLLGGLSLLTAIFLSGCAPHRETGEHVKQVNLLDVTEPSLKDYFKGVETIPLENKDSAYLNNSCLISYVLAEGKLYVFDRSNHAVVVFGLDGSWKETICKYGRGPGEYLMPTDLAFNEKTHSLDILEATGKIITYELTPPHTMLRSIKIPDLRAVHYFIPFGSGYYLFSSYEDSSVNYLDAGNGELTAVSGIPPAERNERAGYHISGNPFYIHDGKLYYVNGADGGIFRIEGDKAEPVLAWDFGRYSFDPDRIDPESDMSVDVLYAVSTSMAGPVLRTQETERYVFANVLFMKQDWNVVLDKETGETNVFSKMKEGMVFYPGKYYDGALYAIWPPEVVNVYFPPDYPLPDEDSNFLLLKFVL